MNQQQPLTRAADFLEWYADFIRRDVMSVDIERHPYLPELEGVAADVRSMSEAHSSDSVTESRLVAGQPDSVYESGAAVQAQTADRGAGSVPSDILKIIENLHTQDNRITSHPLFAVQQKREIAGLDDDYAAAHVWLNEDSETINDPDEIAGLEHAHEEGEDTPGARRVGIITKWEFVTGCLTEQGCKDFIACNGHNLHEPRIYAYSGYRNAEFIAVREWLMSLRPTGASE
jgi:hypothetical protein